MSEPAQIMDSWSSPSFAGRRGFETWARTLIRLPEAGEGSLEYLLPEAHWQELLCRASDAEGWLMALSQATGIYFFPSREWPPFFLRYVKRLGVQRLLEAGAGRGYLTAALAPLAQAAGIAYKAIDKGEGEFISGLPVYHAVEPGDIFAVIHDFRPELVLYAWPPPGQSVAPLLHSPSLCYLIIIGEESGGVAGAREDWLTLLNKKSTTLTRFSRGRTGLDRHAATLFWRRKLGRATGYLLPP